LARCLLYLIHTSQCRERTLLGKHHLCYSGCYQFRWTDVVAFWMHTLHTMAEAAALLTMSKRTLERLIAAKEFPPPVRFTARCVRVPAADVAAYIERKLLQRGRV